MAHTKPKLPVQQLTILAICRFAEPISLTSVLPYLPDMIRSFGVKEKDVAFWAGLCGTTYAITDGLTAVFWGRASDRFGRKYMLVVGVLNNVFTQLLWGFSTNLPMALTARALSGCCNGNVGIMRTMVAELCPWKELQPRAFSILPMMYNVGGVVGPAFGGAFANPLKRAPNDHTTHNNLLWTFPYALPNIICAIFFLKSTIIATLFLEDTLLSRKGKRDYGLELGKKLESYFNRSVTRKRRISKDDEDIRQPLLGDDASEFFYTEERTAIAGKSLGQEPSMGSEIRILTKQTTLCLTIYTLIALQFFTYDQMITWFLSFPRSGPDTIQASSPLKFSYGYGLTTEQIGWFFTCSAIVSIVNLIVSPPIVRKFGTLKCLRIALTATPVVFALTPFCALGSSETSAMIMLTAVWLAKGLCSAFAYPCATMLLTNAAPSLKILGTLNGFGTCTSAIGRAIGPAICGPAFSLGVKHGYMITSFWILGLLSVLAPITCLWLEEGRGFGQAVEHSSPGGEEERAILDGDGQERS